MGEKKKNTYTKRRVLGGKRLLDHLQMVVGQIIDNNLNRIQHHHQTGHREFQVRTDRLLKAVDLDVCHVLGDTQLIDKRTNSTRGNTTATKTNQSVQARVVPASHMVLPNELVQLALGKNRSGQIETTVFSLHRLEDIQLVDEPVVRLTRELKLGGAEGVSDVFETIDKAMCEI